MNQTPFVPGSVVRLTESAKISPFWRSDRFKNCQGVTGKPYGSRGQITLTMRDARGMHKVFYVTPDSLEPIK